MGETARLTGGVLLCWPEQRDLLWRASRQNRAVLRICVAIRVHENAPALLVFALLQCAMLPVLARRDLRQPSGERPD
jgi:hypothetical protein